MATIIVDTIECVLTIAEHGAASPFTAACNERRL